MQNIMQNIILKVALVLIALLVFDLTTSYFYITEVLYWVGLIGASVIIGVYFDRLEDK